MSKMKNMHKMLYAQYSNKYVNKYAYHMRNMVIICKICISANIQNMQNKMQNKMQNNMQAICHLICIIWHNMQVNSICKICQKCIYVKQSVKYTIK